MTNAFAVEWLKKHLYAYQKTGVRAMHRRKGRMLVGDEMGLGKTLQCLALIILKPQQYTPTIVVCPAYLKWVWVKEAERLGISVLALNGRTAPRFGYPKTIPQLIVINYDILTVPVPRNKKQKRQRKMALMSDHFKWIKSLNPQLLILDECQAIKNRSSIRCAAVTALSKGIPGLLALSGTPLTNRPEELFATVRLLWPEEFASWQVYAVRYCDPQMRPWGMTYTGATHLGELHKRLKQYGMLRRLKQDVLKDLPPLHRTVVPLGIKKPTEYQRAHNDFLAWLASHSVKRAHKAAAAEKMVRVGYLKRLAATLSFDNKLQWVKDFLQDNPGEKIVLFAVHASILEKLKKAFGDSAVLVRGGIPQSKRKASVERFQTDPSCRVFIGQFKAAGAGLTLTAARHLAFFELEWTPADHTQAEARIHRITQDRLAQVYYLVATGTIEERLCQILQDKQHVVTSVLDGKGNKKLQLSIQNLLVRSLEKTGRLKKVLV